MDGEMPEQVIRPAVVTMNAGDEAEVIAKERVPKRFSISLKDVQDHGFTAGCPGCKSILRKTARQMHTEACRRRLEKEMSSSAKVMNSKRRVDHFLDRCIEESDKDREQKRAKKNLDGEVDIVKVPDERNDKFVERNDVFMEVEDQMDDQMGKVKDEHEKVKVAARDLPGDMDVEGNAAHERRGEKRSQRDEALEDESDRQEDKRIALNNVFAINEEEDLQFEDYMQDAEWALDDISGHAIDPKKVREAQAEELTFVKSMPVYVEVDIEECIERTGKQPISTKWVDVLKKVDGVATVRSRWVARDFKVKGDKDREDLFAAMPPLEAKKLLFRMAARTCQKGTKAPKLLFIDVCKAHLNGICEQDDVYVQLPEEAGAEGKCGRLRRWLYGMRGAAQGWEDDYVKKLLGVGFKRGRAAATTFFNPTSGVRCVVHGDDFTFLGCEKGLREVQAQMEEWYDVKVRGVLGQDTGDLKKITILNRTLEWTQEGIVYKADAKHAKIIFEEMGLREDSKGLMSPCVKEEWSEEEQIHEFDLDPEDMSKFRRLAARANYLALDRVDIQFAVKELCRDMANPSGESMRKLKRLARYLLAVPEWETIFRRCQEWEACIIDVYTDSDWAGCRRTRRSTSGGVMCVGGDMVKTWSKMQASPALSSGEGEYYVMIKGAVEALGLKSVAEDLGWTMKVRLWVDSSAAKSMASRKGLGRTRHMEVRFLWLQDVVKQKKIVLRKVLGTKNPADVATKPKSVDDVEQLVRASGARAVRKVGTAVAC